MPVHSDKALDGGFRRTCGIPLPETHGACARAILRMAGLRPTKQRQVLTGLLFGVGHRHFSVEDLFAEARAAGAPMSLATVYNTLAQFRASGLVRELPVEGHRTFYDTDTTGHHHYYVEDEGTLVDIPFGTVTLASLPPPPGDTEVMRVDVVVRLRRRPAF